MRIAIVLLGVFIVLAVAYYSSQPVGPIPWNEGTILAEDGISSESSMASTPPTGEGAYWIGVQSECATELIKSQLNISGGLVINEVLPSSAAEQAGLMPHDIILAVNGHRISCCKLLGSMIERSGGSDLRLEVLRAGRPFAVGIKPLPRPECEEFACAAILAEDPNQVWQLPNLKFHSNINPVTGETDLLIFGSGIRIQVGPDGELSRPTNKEIELSLNQINKLSVPYDGSDPGSLTRGQIEDILSQALQAAEAELANLEVALRLLDAENRGSVCELEQLREEMERIESSMRFLRIVLDRIRTQSDTLPKESEQNDPKQSRGPYVPEHRLIVVA